MANAANYVVPALTKHTATVIMAHGLGDSGAGWMSLAQNWRRRGKFPEVAFIFPNAPSIPITVNMGMSMPGWYDIAQFGSSLDPAAKQDERGILKSRDTFNALIQDEINKGIKPERVVVGGFSQGGAMSLFTGITGDVKVGGIFGLSSYLLLADKIKELIPKEFPNKDTPIFMGHGDMDSIVKYEYGVKSADAIKEMGMEVEFKKYPGLDHSADPSEIQDLEEWLVKRLPSEEKL